MKINNISYIVFALFVALLPISLSAQTAWSLTGNSGLNSTAFIGSTGTTPLYIRINNSYAGYLGATTNTSLGYLALRLQASGTNNTAFGHQAMQPSSGTNNVAVGHWTLDSKWSAGSNNIAIGASAMARGGNLYNNIAIGPNAGMNERGMYNIYIGKSAGNGIQNVTQTHSNTVVGSQNLYQVTTGSRNSAIGGQALAPNTTGEDNGAFGSGALNNNMTGSRNTAIGNSSMWNNQSGNENTAIGDEALAGSALASYSVAIGQRALWSGDNMPGFVPFGTGGSYSVVVGWEALRYLTGIDSIAQGQGNVALGYRAMKTIREGGENVAIGREALDRSRNGMYNTAVGAHANTGDTCTSNTVTIGYQAYATKNNTAIVGNYSVTSIGSSVNWTTRVKDAEQTLSADTVPGMAFISLLQPVTYTIAGSTAKHTGFKLADLKAAATSIDYNTGATDGNDGIRYSELIGVLVKAIQELDQRVTSLENP